MKQPGRKEKREEAMKFFMKLMSARIDQIAIENPVGYPRKAFRLPDQIIQPYEYGHEAHKPTCLWLKNLPELVPTDIVEVPLKWDGKRNRHWTDRVGGGSESGRKNRSRTFQGIADAMADQWGDLK